MLRKAIAANKALAELKGAGELIPNQGVLINSIVLQEARTVGDREYCDDERRFLPCCCCGNYQPAD